MGDVCRPSFAPGNVPLFIELSVLFASCVLAWWCVGKIRLAIERRRLLANELLSTQSQLQLALDAHSMALWSWNIRDDVVEWTEPVLRVHAIARADLSDNRIKTFLAFVHAEDRSAVEKAFRTSARDGSAYEIEYRIRRPDGAFQWIAARGLFERDLHGNSSRLSGICTDITARKRLEETLVQAHKMEALGTLAGGVAHDFNNILMAIGGNVELAVGELPPGHPALQNLDRIDKAINRASSLVRQILRFSRQQPPARAVIPLAQEIEEAVRLLRATLPARIEIRVEYLAGVPPVSVDSTQVHQILMNLGANAAHAMGEGSGEISIFLEGVILFADQSESSAGLPPGRYARLRFRDNGCGMDQTTLARAFEPFFTTKEVGKGTGLGLSVIHSIMNNYGGAVTVESVVGVGTTFQLYFPAAELALPAAVAGRSPLQQSPRGSGERILYVDDEESLVLVTKRRLQQLGYEVTGCADPCEALEIFRANPDKFDAVITDISMPRLPGAELVSAVQRIRPDIPVVMCSGYLRVEDQEAAKRLGVCDLIAKPMDFNELARVLQCVLAGNLAGFPS
jgi:PAS domain S-box-containing protein